MLPKLSGEAERRPSLIQVNNKFQAQRSPQVRQRHISADWSQFEICVERETGVLLHEILEGVAIQMIPVGWISRPVRVRVMRSHDSESTSGFSDSMQL